MIAIRTEYYGKFMAGMGRSIRDLSKVDAFYLNELTEREMVEAIKRPTSVDDFKRYGKPFDQYHFEFKDGLPERIAHQRDVNPNIKGGVLPVAQIICENLYRSGRINADMSNLGIKLSALDHFTIRLTDYLGLPKVEVQLEEYLKQKLTEFSRTGPKFRGAMDEEVDRWKDVLSEMSISQVDGTVVTQLKSKEDLKTLANKLGCRLPFDETMAYLSGPGSSHSPWRRSHQLAHQ